MSSTLTPRQSGLACLAALGLAALGVDQAVAAESATGAYLLGLRGQGAGITPPEGVFFSNQLYIYSGSISGNVAFENGQLAGNAELKPIINVPTLIWITPIELGGVKLGTSLTTPFGNVDLAGRLGPFPIEDQTFTFGDPSVGVFLGGSEGQFHGQIGVTAFLPIGDYRRGEFANVSKNRGALDVYGTLTWLQPEWGLDVSNIAGVTFNAENEATRYKTGTEFHWEWSVTKKLESGLSFGGVGYYYQQLTDDSGPGAILGGFRGRVAAVGATLGYDFKVGKVPVSAKVRYYHEFAATNRLEGDSAFLSFSMPLWVPGQ